LDYVTDCRVTNITVGACTGKQVLLGYGSMHQFVGNHIWGAASCGDGIVITDGTLLTFTGNIIESFQQYGVLIDLTDSIGSVEDITFSGNIFFNCSQQTTNTYDAIRFMRTSGSNFCYHIVITGNVFRDADASNKCKYYIDDVAYINLYGLISDNTFGTTVGTSAIGAREARVKITNNSGYIDSGEVRSYSDVVTAGNANAIGFTWHNPELQDILIKKVTIEVRGAGGTVGSHLDVGIADDAAGTNRDTEFFNDLLLNSVKVNDSWVAGDGGTQTKYVLCEDSASGTDGWIVGQILDANAASLWARYYIEYVGR
jgi:hypothetical protein